MITLKVFSIILYLSVLVYPIYTIFSCTVRSGRTKKWSEFNKQLLKWSDEIENLEIRLLFLSEVSIWTLGNVKGDKERKIFEQTILSKYVEHIPSIKQNIRDEKINKLLK
jgi:hypothetical protein